MTNAFIAAIPDLTTAELGSVEREILKEMLMRNGVSLEFGGEVSEPEMEARQHLYKALGLAK